MSHKERAEAAKLYITIRKWLPTEPEPEKEPSDGLKVFLEEWKETGKAVAGTGQSITSYMANGLSGKGKELKR